MAQALQEAAAAPTHGDVPVGAVVIAPTGEVLGRGHNRREIDGDPLAHAELLALRDAATGSGGWRLDGCTVVVTLEPCAMCAGAIVQARAARIVLGAWDERAGACGSVWDVVRDARSPQRLEVVAGVRETECATALADFFRDRRG